MDILNKKGYLEYKSHPEKKKNIKIFFINCNKIKEELFKFMKSVDKDVKIKKSYENNKYLDFFIKELFLSFKKENVT